MALKKYLIQGKGQWCKVIGEAPPGYDDGPPEWTFDLILDDNGKKDLLASGADKFYIKKNKNGQDFVRFTRKAQKKTGEANQPIEIVDHKNEPWGNKLIGNDSTLNVCFTLNEAKHKGIKRMKPSVLSVQVWDHVQFKPKPVFATKDTETGTGSEESWTEE